MPPAVRCPERERPRVAQGAKPCRTCNGGRGRTLPSDYDKRRESVAARKEEVAALNGRGRQVAGNQAQARQEPQLPENAQAPNLQPHRSPGTPPTSRTLITTTHPLPETTTP